MLRAVGVRPLGMGLDNMRSPEYARPETENSYNNPKIEPPSLPNFLHGYDSEIRMLEAQLACHRRSQTASWPVLA